MRRFTRRAETSRPMRSFAVPRPRLAFPHPSCARLLPPPSRIVTVEEPFSCKEMAQSGNSLMKSPFPGMDPYLEVFWGDVHTSLITYARDQLRGQLPAALRVRVEEQVTVQVATAENGPPAKRRTFDPDVCVVERPERSLHIIDTHSGN